MQVTREVCHGMLISTLRHPYATPARYRLHDHAAIIFYSIMVPVIVKDAVLLWLLVVDATVPVLGHCESLVVDATVPVLGQCERH